ncbi:MAG: nucleotide-binding protein [Methylobacter sp.]
MRLHITDGSKGGVGKSQTAHILINYLSRNDKPLIVIETDTQIPDVARCVKNTTRNVQLEFFDIRTDLGWQAMLEELQEIAFDENNKANDVVLSLPGADLDIKQYVDLVCSLAESLNIEIWQWFLLNIQGDSVTLLNESLKKGFASIATKKIAVKNGFFGKEDAFVAFNDSKLDKKMDKVIYIDALSTLAAKKLRAEEVVIDEAIQAAKTGINGGRPDFLYSSNLSTWIKKVDAEISKVLE